VIPLHRYLRRFFKSKSERDFRKKLPLVEEINRHAERLAELPDEELPRLTEEFRRRASEGASLEEILPEAFAAAKEACRRLCGRSWQVVGRETSWNMVPFDVQLAGAIGLHGGSIAEMATGEGKTLVATLPLYLNALTGRGAHLVTVNDYLARRDAEWMGPVYELLGLKVGFIQSDMDVEARKAAYGADITYGTNNEFGFDYLRDNMKSRIEDRVQRGHNYAIVDEVDSVLIDEARTPLIISGPVGPRDDSASYAPLKRQVETLVRKQTHLVSSLLSEVEKDLDGQGEAPYEVGEKLLLVQRGSPKSKRFLKLMTRQGLARLVQRVEADYMREKRIHELEEQLLYAIDEKSNTINVTENGRENLSPQDREIFVLPDLSAEIQKVEEDPSLDAREKLKKKEQVHRRFAERSDTVHNLNQLLKAYTLFEKDVDYVVQEGRVIIVDEFTGRLMPGRRFSDGLHQALEAKEGVKVGEETQTLATITLQNYFRMYDKLAGMTGTAETEAEEFDKIYKLDVQVVPTNEPVRRVDFDDVIYRTRKEKYKAIIDEIVRLHGLKLPILVGTVSVEVSETLSRLLKREGIRHEVLNAKQHQREAEIVASAGEPASVTIATNMAGRGTDIRLGKGIVRCGRKSDYDGPRCMACPLGPPTDGREVLEDPCGLQIVGTERHESRRIDRQLRGRAGRQGDPGSSRFFLSLEDDLMRLFGSERIASIMDRLGAEEGEVISHRFVTRAIEKAQTRVEGYNFGIRKRLLEYDDVMNKQREVVYASRTEAMGEGDFTEKVHESMEETIETLVEAHTSDRDPPELWDLEPLFFEFETLFVTPFGVPEEEVPDLTREVLFDRMLEEARRSYETRRSIVGPELMPRIERYLYLHTLDEKWMDHLHELDYLREGIGLRAYAQKDPLIEYKQEAFKLFAQMNESLHRDYLHRLFHARVEPSRPRETRRSALLERATTHHQEADRWGGPEGEAGAPAQEAESSRVTGAMQRASQAPRRVRTVTRRTPKVGRNDPCPCGSGKKYKKCCGATQPA
jgi:preprotein translocase subunit SecA